MRKWVIRGLLAVLLVVSVDLHAFLGIGAERSVSIETAVKQLLADRGLSFRKSQSFSDTLTSMLFAVPSCSEPLQVIVTPRTFDAQAVLDRISAPDDIRVFAYLSRASEQGARFSFFLEHLKESALGLIAMTSYQTDGMMLVINEPSSCKTVPQVPWAQVWKTAYRERIAREAGKSTR